ncbi:glutathione S-transferase family protein [Roseobacter denitrificans]|uniref:Glutathione S-transferase n=1 Tax=Roseobacter denitrificans (strain ATCC 33942 / OCh 114) TaxID=375451 RepID=Q16C98_ROSDO|nr:glutathione S-transferase family protein [Roseobacter denitrificans]ABG30395.1 glutathione S-transferase [Roseobacter denitrificans OCh 114]AVL53554.1 glutathione S-transferase family protein [Roseobacter denitrificans]SFF72268.1 glutathione S-transferase [Roseobacter denitrificans OCh 114]
MRLYYSPGSIAVAVAITLYEAQLPFEPVKVSFADAEQTKAPYLGLNPKGRVPTLDTGGNLLTETGAILEYIAALAPQAALVPQDPLKAAHMRAVMYYLASTMHVNHAHRLRGNRWADHPESLADMAARATLNMTQNARYVEDHCLKGDFVTGDRLSLADPYLFVVCSWLEGDGVRLDDFPKITAFDKRMRARDGVRQAVKAGMLPA